MADIFQALDKLDSEKLQIVADRLEYRGTYPAFVEMRERYFDRLRLDQCRNVLDMGCGTGVVTRALAKKLPRKAKLTGTDFSAELIKIALRLAEEEGLSERISFEVSDSGNTGNQENKYDLVVLHTLISHVSDPAQVVKEAARVTAAGGHVVVFDGDYASITFGAGDPELNERALQGLLKTVVAQPRAMRQFPELLPGSGLELEEFLPEVLGEVGKADFFESMLDNYIPSMVAAGHLDEDSARRWSATHHAPSVAGTFFGSCNFATYILRKSK